MGKEIGDRRGVAGASALSGPPTQDDVGKYIEFEDQKALGDGAGFGRWY